MDNTALVPYSPPEEIKPPVRRPRVRVVPLLLCAVSLFVYSFSAAKYIEKSIPDGHFFVRFLVGGFVGGVGNVFVMPTGGEWEYYGKGETSAGDALLGQLEKLSDGSFVPSVINRETPYGVTVSEMLSRGRVIPSLGEIYEKHGENAPVVLIIHTHGTEAYAEHEKSDYRTVGKDGVIGIGGVIADRLRDCGINVLHCESAFDETDFNSAYYSAALAIRDYLEEYPSLAYIIDVHRDSVTGADGKEYALTADVGGEKAAKLMFVVGTDYAGSGHIGWRDNLALCARLEVGMEEKYSGLTRGLNIRAASFNQQYTKGSMLVEIGSCANTYEEAARTAEIFANTLAEEIKQK